MHGTSDTLGPSSLVGRDHAARRGRTICQPWTMKGGAPTHPHAPTTTLSTQAHTRGCRCYPSTQASPKPLGETKDRSLARYKDDLPPLLRTALGTYVKKQATVSGWQCNTERCIEKPCAVCVLYHSMTAHHLSRDIRDLSEFAGQLPRDTGKRGTSCEWRCCCTRQARHG